MPRLIWPPLPYFPSTYTNVYGARLSRYTWRAPSGTYQGLELDLDILASTNWIPLVQGHDFESDTSFPQDILNQSIVHHKLGVLPLGQQARVTFNFMTPPYSPNKVQIFINDADGQRLESEFDTPDQPHYWEGDYSVLVTGDGSTNIDVYFRPARFGGETMHALFFKPPVLVEAI